MRDRRLAAGAAAAALAIFGTAASAQSLTLEQALRRLDSSLANVAHVNQSDLLSDEKGARYRAIRTLIRDKQCASRTANPLLLVSVPTRVSLKGSVQQGAGVQIAAGAEALDIPLHIAALADLPGEYMKESIALAESKGMPQEVVARMRFEAPRNFEKLTLRIGEMLATFDPAACPRRPTYGGRADWDRLIIFVPPSY
jgi:hypothetical protein